MLHVKGYKSWGAATCCTVENLPMLYHAFPYPSNWEVSHLHWICLALDSLYHE